jgi:hypothetical protein
MSYRCNFCGEGVPSGVHCHKVVTAWRQKAYPARRNCNRPIWAMQDGKLKKVQPSCDDPGGHGTEAIQEVAACPDCAKLQGVNS